MVAGKNGGGHTAEKVKREISFFNQCNFTNFEPKCLRYHQSKWEVCKSTGTGNQGDHQSWNAEYIHVITSLAMPGGRATQGHRLC